MISPKYQDASLSLTVVNYVKARENRRWLYWKKRRLEGIPYSGTLENPPKGSSDVVNKILLFVTFALTKISEF
jgi:hypothetical protein